MRFHEACDVLEHVSKLKLALIIISVLLKRIFEELFLLLELNDFISELLTLSFVLKHESVSINHFVKMEVSFVFLQILCFNVVLNSSEREEQN